MSSLLFSAQNRSSRMLNRDLGDGNVRAAMCANDGQLDADMRDIRQVAVKPVNAGARILIQPFGDLDSISVNGDVHDLPPVEVNR